MSNAERAASSHVEEVSHLMTGEQNKEHKDVHGT
jgi:hypothetical protein